VRAMKTLRCLLTDEKSNCETRRKSAGTILRVGGILPDRRRKNGGAGCRGLRSAAEQPRSTPGQNVAAEAVGWVPLRHPRGQCATMETTPREEDIRHWRTNAQVVGSVPSACERVGAEAAPTLQLQPVPGEAAETLRNFSFRCTAAAGEIVGNSIGQEVITTYSGSFGDAGIRVVKMPQECATCRGAWLLRFRLRPAFATASAGYVGQGASQTTAPANMAAGEERC
jgi:hypothetical protein